MKLLQPLINLFKKPEVTVEEDKQITIVFRPQLGPMVWAEGKVPSPAVQARAIQRINAILAKEPIKIQYREKNEAVVLIFPTNVLYDIENVDIVQG